MLLSWVDSAHPLPLPTWGHLANTGDILAVTVRVWGLLPSEVWRPEMLNFWWCIRRPCCLLLPTTTKNFSTQNGNGAQLRNPDQHSSFLLILLRVMFPSLWRPFQCFSTHHCKPHACAEGAVSTSVRGSLATAGEAAWRSLQGWLCSTQCRNSSPCWGWISLSLGVSRWLVLSTHLCKDTPSVLYPSHHDP